MNCSLKSVCTFKNKNAEEGFKVLLAYSAIKVVFKRHFKDAQEVAQQKVTLFFKFYSPKKHITQHYDFTVLLRYDGTGQELTYWSVTLSWLAVTNIG